MKTRRALLNRAQDTCRAFAKTEAGAGEKQGTRSRVTQATAVPIRQSQRGCQA